jgi:conjugal transfer pilus assembly protein TraV
MKHFVLTAITAAIIGLSGCSTTGLDASNQFKCTVKDGFKDCESISETYTSSISGKRSGQNDDTLTGNPYLRKTPYSGMPIRTPVSVLRIWVAPWEDRDGDLRDQSFMFVALNESRWQIEHNQEAIVDEYRPTIRLLGDDNQPKNVPASDDQLPDLGLTAPASSLDRTKDPLSVPPNLVPPPIKN